MDLSSLLHDFPDFFRNVVKTTSEFGPLALGILLLCIFVFFSYQIRGSLGNNRLLQFGAGALVFVFGCLLLFFTYQAFQFYLKTEATVPVVLVQGTITYQLPDKSGDLTFDVQGVDTKGGGDVSEHFYGYSKYITERRILGIAKPDILEIRVANRQVYRVCNEDSPKVGTRNKVNQTTYQVSLKGAYQTSVPLVEGITQYGIDFDYESHHGSPDRDFLKITQFRGIDASKVKVVRVRHEPDSCLDAESANRYAQIVMQNNAQVAPAATTALSLLATLRDTLVSMAHGAPASQVDKNKAFNFLGASDGSLASKAMTEVEQAPASFAPMIAGLLKQTDAKASVAQVNALVALKNATPKPYRLADSAIPNVVELSYAGPAEVRQAARNYLTDLDIVDERIVKIVSNIFEAQKREKKLDPERYLLLLITARDVYYAAGVDKLVDYVGDWGKRKREPDTIAQSIANFQSGIDLIKDVPPPNVVPFAKPYYGMALALRSRAVVDAALVKLGAKATSHQIDEQVTALVNKGAPLPFTSGERKIFIATIDDFLALVKGREDEYFWPQHIAKMKACRTKQTYDCLHTE